MLHQLPLRLGRQLPLEERLRRHQLGRALPRPGPDAVLFVHEQGIRRVRGAQDPRGGRVQEGGGGWGQEGGCCVAGEGEGDLLHERLFVPGELGSLLWQGD